MIAQPEYHPRLTPDEYLVAEAKFSVKHEYHDGEVYTMAGASDEHNLITGNFYTLLRSHLRGSGCQTFFADMKVHIDHSNRYSYPDLLVTCDPQDRENCYIKRHLKLIIEILSDNTEAFERGDKFHNYCQLDSLEEYILVSQSRPLIDVLRRGDASDSSWRFHTYTADDIFRLESLDFEGAIAQIYEDVTFPPKFPSPKALNQNR
ncbi:MAG: Uma2 family endonuclease [Cyanophyceae cyanobacterium]